MRVYSKAPEDPDFQVFDMLIWGVNPPKPAIASLLPSEDFDAYAALFWEESNWQQFWPYTRYSLGDVPLTIGPPKHGKNKPYYGIVQKTHFNNILSNTNAMWDWKVNLSAGSAQFLTCLEGAKAALEAWKNAFENSTSPLPSGHYESEHVCKEGWFRYRYETKTYYNLEIPKPPNPQSLPPPPRATTYGYPERIQDEDEEHHSKACWQHLTTKAWD